MTQPTHREMSEWLEEKHTEIDDGDYFLPYLIVSFKNHFSPQISLDEAKVFVNRWLSKRRKLKCLFKKNHTKI